MAKCHDILIVEDRPEIAVRLKEQVCQTEGLNVCGMASTIDQGLQMIFDCKPRVALVDLGLPDGSGVEVVRAISKADWPCDALVISIFGDESRVVEAISAGARGYVLKNGTARDVGADILALIAGGSPISPQIARHLLTLLKHGMPGSNTPQINLTPREAELLQAVSRGYKRKEIAERFGITQGTVGNHINMIYRKLDVSSNTAAVAKATRIGLL